MAQARDLIENIRFEKQNFFICAFVLSPLVSLAQPQDLIKTADLKNGTLEEKYFQPDTISKKNPTKEKVNKRPCYLERNTSLSKK